MMKGRITYQGERATTGEARVLILEGGQRRGTLKLPAIDRQLEARHSPTGFEWGYGGSGPAELARALLMAAVPEEARRPVEGVRHPSVYQRFKAQVVQGLNRYQWELSEAQIRAWWENHRAAEHHDTTTEKQG